jgi:hypothetical protein
MLPGDIKRKVNCSKLILFDKIMIDSLKLPAVVGSSSSPLERGSHRCNKG